MNSIVCQNRGDWTPVALFFAEISVLDSTSDILRHSPSNMIARGKTKLESNTWRWVDGCSVLDSSRMSTTTENLQACSLLACRSESAEILYLQARVNTKFPGRDSNHFDYTHVYGQSAPRRNRHFHLGGTVSQ